MKNYIIFALIIFLLINSCSGFETVSDNLILENYQPFKDETKAVKLSETTTLRLENNLPRIDGATALYPLYSAFVQAIYPEGEYSPYGKNDYRNISGNTLVRSSGTSNAYSALVRGEVDIIFCAGPSNDQIEWARERGITFNLTQIGKEAFVFFVNNRNPVTNLTIEQIKGIYSGNIKNWKIVGGRNEKIRAFQRAKNSGSQSMLESIMGVENIIPPITENVLTFMLDIIERTSDYRNHRNAIGYSFLFFTTQMVQNNRINILSINDVFPSKETIQNDEYPFIDYFYAITTGTENENVYKFIQWILSEQGQYLVEQTGYVPLR